MLIILDIHHSLIVKSVGVLGVLIGCLGVTVNNLSQHTLHSLIDYWNRILADNDAIKIVDRFDLLEPIVLSDVSHCEPQAWLSVKDLTNKVFASGRDESRNEIVTTQDFLI